MFFTRTIINNFINSKSTDGTKSVKTTLENNVDIITLDDLIDLLYITPHYTRYNTLNRSKEDFYKQQKKYFIKNFYNGICGGNISDYYGRKTMRNAILNENFDIAIIFNKKIDKLIGLEELPESYREEEEFIDSQSTQNSDVSSFSDIYIPQDKRFINYEDNNDEEYAPSNKKKRVGVDENDLSLSYFNDLMSNAVSFIVVEKGECKKYPETYSINLICAKPGGWGQIMMALYLYTIANNTNVIVKRGILELANGYLNPAGLCMYSKFGFEYDETLYGNDCFSDYNNLPMITGNIDSVKIIDVLLGLYSYSKPFICNVRDKELQIFVGACMNIQRFIDLQQMSYTSGTVLSSNYVVNYEEIYNTLENNISSKKIIKKNNINSLINQVEQGHITTFQQLPNPYKQAYDLSITIQTTGGKTIKRKKTLKSKSKRKTIRNKRKTIKNKK